jgi:YD repeat-containing protein
MNRRRLIVLCLVLAAGCALSGALAAVAPAVPPPTTASFTFVPPSPETGQEVTFTSTSNAAPGKTLTAEDWDFNNDGVFDASGTIVTHTFATAGTHPVTLRVTDDNGDSSIASQNVIVTDRPPVASLNVSPNPASTGDTVNFDASASTDPDGTITDYKWDLDGNGTFETDTGASATTSANYATAQSITVKVRVTDNDGSTSDASQSLVINDRPPSASFTISPNPAAINQSVSFDASASSDPDGTIAKYEWDLDGNGTFETDTGTSPTTSKSYATAQSITVQVRVTDNDGSTNVTSKTLNINSPPTASLNVTPNPALSGQNVSFDASGSSDSDGTITKYEWDLDGNGTFETDTGTSPTTSTSYPTARTLTVKVRVTDNNGGTGTASQSLTINNRAPSASFTISPNPAATGQSVSFDASASTDPDGTIADYKWDLDGNGTFETDTGTDPTASRSYSSSGSVSVKLRVTDNDGGTDVATQTLSINHPPTAAIDATPNPALTGQSVSFDASGSSDSDGTIVKYEWDLDGNGTYEVNTDANPTTSTSYPTARALIVRVRVTDNDGATTSASLNLTIDDRPPTASFTATPNPALTNQTVSFDASGSTDPDGTITNYKWDLDGDGTFETNTGSNPTTSRSYAGNGPVSVKVRVTDNDGSTNDATVALVVNNRPPTASLTATPNPALTNQTVSFDASASSDPDGTITNYKWDLDGNGTFETDTGTTATASRSYATSGTVLVQVRVTDNDGATSVATKNVTINQPPTATFTASPNPALTGQSVSFDATGSGDSDGTIVKYEWDLNGDGTFETDSGTDPTVQHTYPDNGAFLIKLRVTDDGGASTVFSRNMTVNDRPPTASFTISPNPASTDQTVSFDASDSGDVDGTITKYEWDLDGNGSFETDTGTTPTASHSYSTGGAVTIKLRVTDDDGNTAQATRTLTVTNQGPVASFTVSPNPADTGQTVSFDGSGSADPDGTITSYEWDLDGNGTFETDSGSDPTVSRTYASAQAITVKLRVTDDHGKVSQASHQLTINNRPPTASFSVSPSPVLTGKSISFDASASQDPDGTITSYEWDLDGNGTYETTTASASTTHTYTSTGPVTVKLRVTDNNGATAEATKSIDVQAAPTASFTISPNPALINQPVSFDASASRDSDGTIAKYEWDLDGNGTFETDTGTNPHATKTYTNGNDVTVKLRVTDNDGNTDVQPQTVLVNTQPVAITDFHADPASPVTGDQVTFSATATAGGSGNEIVDYKWNLDGSGSNQYEVDTGASPTAVHTYGYPRTLTVGVEAFDKFGNVAQGSFSLTVGNRPPEASFGFSPSAPHAGDTVSFFSTAHDPDTAIAEQSWDLNGDGIFGDATGPSAAAVFTSPGSYLVSLMVTDSEGASTIATVTVVVGARAPVVQSGARISLLSPFPVVRIAGTIKRQGTRLRNFSVTAPFGATVLVRCKGKGCPFRRQTSTARLPAKQKGGTAPATKLIHIRRLERRLLRAGMVVRVFVTKQGTIGKFTQFVMKKRRPPARIDRCLAPGSLKPVQCPAS